MKRLATALAMVALFRDRLGSRGASRLSWRGGDFPVKLVARAKSPAFESVDRQFPISAYRPLTEAKGPHHSPAGSACILLILLVPQEGFEPPTPSLRMMCSTN